MADARKITRRRLKHYPEPKLALRFRNPLQLLIAVILSAQCTDARVNEVTKTLFKKYKKASDYANADLATFEQAIRPAGFYHNKAKTVIKCCQQLVADYHGKVPANAEELMRLAGVGRKTANMVAGNVFGAQAIAVDTHVARVSQRLSLSRNKSADKVEQDLMAQVPHDKWTAFSNAMILHGREVCTARKPRCCECALYVECAWPEKPPC
ncbi:MAG: endonuclease III [Pseudomonadota bacterium]|nr:MAG: endonuclease III [Pseudomonadota bacterium]